jgi:hypothetical protein
MTLVREPLEILDAANPPGGLLQRGELESEQQPNSPPSTALRLGRGEAGALGSSAGWMSSTLGD